ncbi:hypothetical protein AK812_SmicGene47351, partial [Symbiodinium microadriaticum]
MREYGGVTVRRFARLGGFDFDEHDDNEFDDDDDDDDQTGRLDYCPSFPASTFDVCADLVQDQLVCCTGIGSSVPRAMAKRTRPTQLVFITGNAKKLEE